jgi:transposase
LGAVARTQLRETPVKQNRTCVGLDVHARSVWACTVDDDSGEMRTARISPKTAEIVKWAKALPGVVEVAYEAGPTGFGLARALIAAGVTCQVLAPSKMERPSGDRVKTDKRDSEWIARLVRLGELPVVVIPSEGQEAARDLVRAREDVRGDLMRARHRLSKLLLRQGFVFDGTAWTAAHDAWLRSQSFDKPGVRFAFDEAYDTVLTTLARRDRLDKAITVMAAEPAWQPVVARLGCLRGVGTLTGFGLAVEIGDWHRFTGNSIGAFVGLTPSEHSSGGSRSVGSITKAGNGHARRLLVESSWHHRKPYRLSAEMIRRRDGQSPAVRARADQANRRLNQRWRTFDARKKRSTTAAVGVARELAGWCWSLAVMDDEKDNCAMNRQG